MKKLVFIVLPFISFVALAHDTTTIEQYCRMVISERSFSTKVKIELDLGAERKLFSGDTRLRDELTGKLKKFSSVVDALNYMGAQGWELVNAFPMGDSRIYHYYFRRRFRSSGLE